MNIYWRQIIFFYYLSCYMIYTGVDYCIFVKGNSVHNVFMMDTLMSCASKWLIQWYLREFSENMTICRVNIIPVAPFTNMV